VYTLAQDPDSLGEARQLVPRLLARGETAAAFDTAGMVCSRTGANRLAGVYLDRAMDLVQGEDPSVWSELYLNAAEVHSSLGNRKKAKTILDRLLAASGETVRTDPRTRKLLSELGKRKKKSGGR
jgi:hypothetical protein